MNEPNLSAFIWSVADLLRGDYKQSEYGKVILPFTVLRRLDCVLSATKPAVLAEKALREKAGLNPEPFLLKKAGQLFFNTSPLDLKKLMGDQDHIGENLRGYVQGFSAAVRDIFESFEIHTQIDKLAKSGLLYLVTEKFVNVDLHPEVVSNAQMGLVFEELIRKFAELSNETAGEHFTPREVIRLMVNLLFIEDDQALTKPGVGRWRTLDACGDASDVTYDKGDSQCVTWKGCADGNEVTLCTVTGGGHTWPGGTPIPALGYTTMDLDATNAMLDFFAKHPGSKVRYAGSRGARFRPLEGVKASTFLGG
jgi:hypothetical protein